MFFTAYVLCSFRLFKLVIEGQDKQQSSTQSYKTESKILVYPVAREVRYKQTDRQTYGRANQLFAEAEDR